MSSTIILYIAPAVKNLKEFSPLFPYITNRDFVSDMVEEIVLCLSSIFTAKTRLENFIIDISNGLYEYGSTIVPPRLNTPILLLAMMIQREVRDNNLYLPDGRFPFQYKQGSNKHFNDLLLLRTNELPLSNFSMRNNR
jgi:hypothetical protein